jgi:hypothetical protein
LSPGEGLPTVSPIWALARAVIARALVSAVVVMGAYALEARGQPIGEYEVKAAYLYHLAKLADWPEPEPPDSPFSVCLLGDHPIAPLLKRLEGRTVRGRAIGIRYLAEERESPGCQILFVAECRAIGTLQAQPVLTVGDCPGFAESGGMVELVREGDKVRLTVNLAAARSARLRFDPHLLKLARAVGGPVPATGAAR